MSRPESYVGVSGLITYKNVQPSGLVVTEPQQLFVEGLYERTGLSRTGRALALGVKATHKTQYLDTENKYGADWYPVGQESFASALGEKVNHPRSLGVAQTYLDINHVADAEYREDFTQQILTRGKSWLRAIQFDMLPWHSNDDMQPYLENLKDQNQDIKIFLQCHKPAAELLGVRGAVKKLGNLANSLDYVLFDSSHGTGIKLDTNSLDNILEEAHSSEALVDVGFAVAGGLDAQNVRELLPELLAKYPDISWDSEARLHPLNNVGKRPLNLDLVKDYFAASREVLEDK